MNFVGLEMNTIYLGPYYLLVKIKDFLQTFQGKKDVTSVFADINLDTDEDQSGEPRRPLKYMDELVRSTSSKTSNSP